MAGKSIWFANYVLSNSTGNPLMSQSALALFTRMPLEDGTGYTDANYSVRYSIVNADWATVANGVKQNKRAISFPAAPVGGYQPVLGWGIFDTRNKGQGNLLWYGEYPTPIVVAYGDVFTIPVNGITLYED